jgi:hypothetical protein
VCQIWGSHDGDYVQHYLPERGVAWCGRRLTTFLRHSVNLYQIIRRHISEDSTLQRNVYIYIYIYMYCRVLPGNATNNLWVLNLTLGLFEYSPRRITVSRFTILQHINFTFWLLSGVSFGLHWTDFYSRLMLHCRLIWPFTLYWF